MSQKKCVTIYGYSDDLVEIENSQYKEDEIDCYDKAIRFYFVDGTIISICYAQGGVWKITHEAIGKHGTSSLVAKMMMTTHIAMSSKLTLKLSRTKSSRQKQKLYRTYKNKIEKSQRD